MWAREAAGTAEGECAGMKLNNLQLVPEAQSLCAHAEGTPTWRGSWKLQQAFCRPPCSPSDKGEWKLYSPCL
jgi:hypothetical protein